LARARAWRWRGGACLSSRVIWKDVLLSCPWSLRCRMRRAN